ncbi:MAG: methyl-accepting chemotaxis protein [Bacillota bacterium]
MHDNKILLEHEKKINLSVIKLVWGITVAGYSISIPASYFGIFERSVQEIVFSFFIGLAGCILLTASYFWPRAKKKIKYGVVFGLTLVGFQVELFQSTTIPMFIIWLLPVVIACLYFLPRLAVISAVLNYFCFAFQLFFFNHPYYTMEYKITSMLAFTCSYPLVAGIIIFLTIQARKMLLTLGENEEGQKILMSELNDIVTKGIEISDQVSQSSKKLLDAVSSSERAIQTSNSTSMELSGTVEQVSATLSEVSESSGRVTKAAVSGGQAIEEIARQMEAIKSLVQRLASMIEELDKSSHKIGDVTELIFDISEQTNLLALNAAIEAARAGEYGRGFAVVAEEVRNLAENSGKAAGEVAQLIKKVQHETSDVVEAMGEGLDAFDNCSKLASETGEKFNGIIKTIQTSAEQISEIALAVKEIEMTGQQVAASSEEQLSLIQSILNEAEKLSEVADALNTSLKRQSA